MKAAVSISVRRYACCIKSLTARYIIHITSIILEALKMFDVDPISDDDAEMKEDNTKQEASVGKL